MKKRKKGRKFNRKKDQRKSFLKSLAQNLALKGKIKTTEARAKEVAGFLEKKITRAKNPTLQNRRMLLEIFSEKAVKKLINEIAPSCGDKKGGYTRITKLGQRKSNGAKIAIIEILKKENADK